TEGLVDLGAEAIGMDPVAFRLKNLMQDGTYPRSSPAGMRFEGLSHIKSMGLLVEMMDYRGLRAQQELLRGEGVHRGIGFASFIELTNPSPFMYGIGGARISAQDGCTVRIDPDGSVVAATGVTEQGQGTEAIIRQIVAEAALQAGLATKEAALKVAGAMLQAVPDTLDLVLGNIVDKATGAVRMSL